MDSSPKNSLLNFESLLDKQVSSLPLLSLPLRSVLTGLYHVVDGLFHGNRLEDKPQKRPIQGQGLAARLSYLTPFILKCPAEPIGESAFDALSVMALDEIPKNLQLLIGYGHLCELMPEIHRGYYRIEGTEKHFLLSYRNDSFCQSELKDVVLTELARPFLVIRKWHDEEIFDSQVAKESSFDLKLMAATIKRYYLHNIKNTFELPILTAEGFEAAVHTTFEEFCIFRAAWNAVADYSLGMASAICRRGKKLSQEKKEVALQEVFEWTAVMLNERFLSGLIIGISGIPSKKFDALLKIFSIGPSISEAEHSGDGFFPPIFRLGNCYLFNPNVLQLMLNSRNIPYALNKLDREHFDNFVSQHMEPQLVSAASKLFERLEGIQIVKNYKWQDGEFDLLVYRPSENVALHIQAKAAIPPDGARMVRALECRSKEGLKQLQAFRDLSAGKIDAIISRAVNRNVRNVRIVDVLLGWSGFGTNEVWSMMSDVAPMNLALLCNLVETTPDMPFLSFSEQAHELINKICAEVSPKWERKEILIGDTIIEVPLLNINTNKIIPFKNHLIL